MESNQYAFLRWDCELCGRDICSKKNEQVTTHESEERCARTARPHSRRGGSISGPYTLWRGASGHHMGEEPWARLRMAAASESACWSGRREPGVPGGAEY